MLCRNRENALISNMWEIPPLEEFYLRPTGSHLTEVIPSPDNWNFVRMLRIVIIYKHFNNFNSDLRNNLCGDVAIYSIMICIYIYFFKLFTVYIQK